MSTSNNTQLININALNRTDNFKEIGAISNWKELDKWIIDQEKYFQRNKIDSDNLKINHIIMNIDVRHWGRLENYFKYNQQPQPTYEMLKKVLLKKIKRLLDPTMSKYDAKVDAFIDKINILNLNLSNLLTWMKKLRSICDGQAKNEYLIAKVLSRVIEVNKSKVCKILLKEIKDHIEVYESRIINSQIGKEKKKELNQLKEMRKTIKMLLLN